MSKDTDTLSSNNPELTQFGSFLELLCRWDRMHGQQVFCYQGFVESGSAKKNKDKTLNYGFCPVRHEEVGACWKELQEANRRGYCISVGINEFGRDGEFPGRRREHVSRVRAHVVDIDTFLERRVLREVVALWRPSFVVCSSQGDNSEGKEGLKTHFYWRYEYTGLAENECVALEQKIIERYNKLQYFLAYACEKQIHQVLKEHESEVKTKVDYSISIEKMMRCPGFYHTKKQGKEKLVSLVHVSEDLEQDGISCSEKGIEEFFVSRMKVDGRLQAEALGKWEAERKLKREKLQASIGENGETNKLLESAFEGYEEGERHEKLFSWANELVLRRGLSREDTLVLLREGNEKNNPPVEEEELEGIVDSVLKYKIDSLSQSGLEAARRGDGVTALELFEKRAAKMAAVEREVRQNGDSGLEDVEDENIFLYDYSNEEHFLEVLSDRAISARVYQRFGGEVRWNEGLGNLVYDGNQGIFCGQESKLASMYNRVLVGMKQEEIVRRQFEVSEKVEVEGDDGEIGIGIIRKFSEKKFNDWVCGKRSAASFRSLVESIRLVSEFYAGAGEFDREDELLCVRNGVIDLRSGKLRAWEPELLMTKRCAVSYACGAWEKYKGLESKKNWVGEGSGANEVRNWKKNPGGYWTSFIWDMSLGDIDMCRFLQQVAGYVLCGRLDQQKLFFLSGKGANGKSTFLETILRMLGSYGGVVANSMIVQVPGKHGIRDNYANSSLAGLVGCRGVLCEEVQEGQVLNESLIKDITTGATVEARFLYKNTFKYRPQFTLMMHGNSKPEIKGNTHGIWRRIVNIECLANFTEELGDDGRWWLKRVPGSVIREDRAIKENMLRDEVLSEVLVWAVTGYIEMRAAGGLKVPEKCNLAVQKYRDSMHPIETFLRDVCIGAGAGVGEDEGIGESVGEDEGIDTDEFRRLFDYWCAVSGKYEFFDQAQFGRKMSEYGIEKKQLRREGKRCRFYQVNIKPEWLARFKDEGNEVLGPNNVHDINHALFRGRNRPN